MLIAGRILALKVRSIAVTDFSIATVQWRSISIFTALLPPPTALLIPPTYMIHCLSHNYLTRCKVTVRPELYTVQPCIRDDYATRCSYLERRQVNFVEIVPE